MLDRTVIKDSTPFQERKHIEAELGYSWPSEKGPAIQCCSSGQPYNYRKILDEANRALNRILEGVFSHTRHEPLFPLEASGKSERFCQMMRESRVLGHFHDQEVLILLYLAENHGEARGIAIHDVKKRLEELKKLHIPIESDGPTPCWLCNIFVLNKLDLLGMIAIDVETPYKRNSFSAVYEEWVKIPPPSVNDMPALVAWNKQWESHDNWTISLTKQGKKWMDEVYLVKG